MHAIETEISLEQGTALLILGHDEEASFKLAINIASRHGSYRFASMLDHFMERAFGLGRALNSEPQTLIVSAFCGTAQETCFLKGLILSKKVLIDEPMRPSRYVQAPHVIVIATPFNDGRSTHQDTSFRAVKSSALYDPLAGRKAIHFGQGDTQ